MTNEPVQAHRRSRAEMFELKARMRELEALGVPRATIALRLRTTTAQVTRYLGAKRDWKDRRGHRPPHHAKLP